MSRLLETTAAALAFTRERRHVGGGQDRGYFRQRAGHGAFNNFNDPAISGSNVAFYGGYSGGDGIIPAPWARQVRPKSSTPSGHCAGTRGIHWVWWACRNQREQRRVSWNLWWRPRDLFEHRGATGATKIVDFGNVAAGHGAFTGFGNPAISGNNVAFLGLYSGGRGIRGTVGATAATKIVEIWA